jgi:hypothetical protein
MPNSNRENAMDKGTFVKGWAEDRICETWQSGIDPNHPAALEAAQWEQRNAQLFAEAREAGRKVADIRDANLQSAVRRILAWFHTDR